MLLHSILSLMRNLLCRIRRLMGQVLEGFGGRSIDFPSVQEDTRDLCGAQASDEEIHGSEAIFES